MYLKLVGSYLVSYVLEQKSGEFLVLEKYLAEERCEGGE